MRQRNKRQRPPTSGSKKGNLAIPFQVHPKTAKKYKAFGYRDPESDGIVQTLSCN